VPIRPLKRRSARLTDVTVRRQPPRVNAVRINPRVAKTKTEARRQRDKARMVDYNSRKQSEMPFFSITNKELYKCLPKNDCFHQFTESLFLQLEDEYHLNELNKVVQQRNKGRITEAIKHLDSTLNTISTYIKSFGKNKLIFRLLKCVEKEVQEISKNLKPIIDFMYARRGGLSESEDDSDDSAEVLYPS